MITGLLQFELFFVESLSNKQDRCFYGWISLGHFIVATVAGNFLPIKHGMLHGVNQDP